MKYNITNVHEQSDMVEFSWENCGGIRVISILYDGLDKACSVRCMRKNQKGNFDNCQYDWNHEIIFFKKQGYNYVAWIKFLNGKWEKIE